MFQNAPPIFTPIEGVYYPGVGNHKILEYAFYNYQILGQNVIISFDLDFTDIKIIRQRRASISLKIGRDGSIVVRAPHLIPEIFIREFIKKNSEFIEKNRKKIMVHAPVKRKYIEGGRFLYLGKEYSLEFSSSTQIKLSGAKILVPKALSYRLKIEMEKWYIKQAKEIIGPLVEEYAKKLNTSYVSLMYSDTISKWGSCTYDNRLQFNWRLVMAPILVVRYVVIHELVHTTEKHHKKAFWEKVRQENPSYKEQIKWLKTHGNKIIE
jgi:predicted metal-dependent hydrolase